MRFGSTCRNPRFARATRPAAAAILSAWLAVAAVANGHADTAGKARDSSQPGAFRSAVELVALQVSVVDPQHRYVDGLRVDDFGVYEEGAPQAVALFSAATAPLDVMVLLDTSASMKLRMPVAQDAAIAFVRELRAEDRAAVVLFSTGVRVVQPLTSEIPALERAIRGAQARGGTSIHQAVYIALRELTRARRGDQEPRRQALVVLSDGEDNTSSISFEDAIGEARRAGVTIFTILPAPDAAAKPFDPDARGRGAVPFEMRTLAGETGGRTFVSTHRDNLSAAYREVAEELRHQYWLAYVPASASQGYRRIAVRVVTRPGLVVRTRSGYYATSSRHGTLP